MEAMANLLPRLRGDLDFMPSPLPDRPGLLIRDPHRYSDVTLIIPPPLVECLRFFDGQSTDLDLRAQLVRLTRSLEVSELLEQLVGALERAGFLENETYRRLKEQRQREFREAPYRAASHAGAAYPDDPAELRAMLDRFFREAGPADPLELPGSLVGIAAPHVSFEGGWRCYAKAYQALPEDFAGRVFVILATSHYGTPNRFGLTRKPFRTPFGEAPCATEIVDWLAQRAPASVELEDYCHATEHAAEFQVVFLQHRFHPGIRIVPILVGAFLPAGPSQRLPEETPSVGQFFEALKELGEREAGQLVWVLGIDLAHIGRRYGDPFDARAEEGFMVTVAGQDRERLSLVAQGDAASFWALLGRDWNDELKWCGSSALYTFLRANPAARGQLLDYGQWNIDERSVVTFGALAFYLPR